MPEITSKVLVLVFETSDGTTVKVNINNPEPTKAGSDINVAANQMKDAGVLCATDEKTEVQTPITIFKEAYILMIQKEAVDFEA